MIYEGLATVLATDRPRSHLLTLAGESLLFDYDSYEGTAEYYGITEFTDVSDPPRKYLQLHPNRGEIRRSGATTPAFEYVYLSRMVRFNVAGTKTNQLSLQTERPGTNGSANSDTFESFVGQDDFATKPMAWVKTKRRKYTIEPVVPAAGEVAVVFDWHPGREGDHTTSNGQVFMRVSWPRWKGTYWECTTVLSMVGDNGTMRLSLNAGSQDPGDPETVGIIWSGETLKTLYLPPDCSLLLWARGAGWGTEWDGVTFPADFVERFPAPWNSAGLTDAELPEWFYFPSGSGYSMDDYMDLNEGERRYEERLSVEDTLVAAMLRSMDLLVGTENVATTTSLSGGLSAESHSPIQWEGRVVSVTKLFTGLTIGHIYSVSVTVRTNTIGLTDYVNSFDTSGADFTAVATSHSYTFELRAPLGFERIALSMSTNDLGAIAVPVDYDTETILYWGRVLFAGGTLTVAELAIADSLIVAMKAAGVWTKCCYFLPLLGDFTAILVPLRDRDAAGNATNTAFVAGDYSLATGLQGNGSSKQLTVPRNGAELGSGNNGGLGYWALVALNTGTSGAGIGMGTGSQFFRLIPKGGSSEILFDWGAVGARASFVDTVWTGFCYGQRASSTSRVVSRDDVDKATDTDSDTGSSSNAQDFRVLGDAGISGTRYTAGTCGCAWFDDGTLSGAQRTSLYEILRDELMTPTGRI